MRDEMGELKKANVIDIQEMIYVDSLQSLPVSVLENKDFDFKENLRTFRIHSKDCLDYKMHYNKDYIPSPEFIARLEELTQINKTKRDEIDKKFNIDSVDSIMLCYTTVELLIKDYPRFEKYTKIILA